MRLQCYRGDWYGYALYALIIIVVYILGLPVAVFVLLFRHRHQLFPSKAPGAGAGDVGVAEKYGFLYQVRGWCVVDAWLVVSGGECPHSASV
jgi:hypothetical protein